MTPYCPKKYPHQYLLFISVPLIKLLQYNMGLFLSYSFTATVPNAEGIIRVLNNAHFSAYTDPLFCSCNILKFDNILTYSQRLIRFNPTMNQRVH